MADTDSREVEILLVDDDPDAGPLLAELLERRGRRVVRCPDGHAALAYLATHPLPAVIVLDVRMPLMDGIAFRSMQRREWQLRGIPVIAIGNPAYWELRRLAPDAFVPRPFTVDRLLAAIADVRRPVTARTRRAGVYQPAEHELR